MIRRARRDRLGHDELRAYLMDTLGGVPDRVSAPMGILQVENGAFEAAWSGCSRAGSPSRPTCRSSPRA